MAFVPPFGSATVSAAASAKVALYSKDYAAAYVSSGYPNFTTKDKLLVSVNNSLGTSAAISAASTVTIQAGPLGCYYDVGASAAVHEIGLAPYQGAPNALDATGTLTAAMILGGIVTSSTAAAVTATVDTGTIMDAASTFAIGDSVDWTAINTGGTNAFTVTAATGHTLVGAGAVAANTSGRFRTRKTAANTFITYRLS